MQPLQEIAASSLPLDIISLIYAAGGHWQEKRLAGVYSYDWNKKYRFHSRRKVVCKTYEGNQKFNSNSCELTCTFSQSIEYQDIGSFSMMSLVIRRGNSNKLWSVSHLNKRPTPAGSTSLIEQAIVLLKIMWAKKQLTGEESDHVFYFNHLLYLFTRSQSWRTSWNFWSLLKSFWQDLRSTWSNLFFPCVHLSGM